MTSEPVGSTGRGEVPARVLADIAQLPLRARVLADSVLAGIHRSRHHGSSVEFAEHKEYSAGDDLRHLDWRAYARFERDYIKRFEDEANVRALCVIDTSGSMAHPSEPRPADAMRKLDFAATCAGALAYVLARQGDAVGLASFDERLEMRLPARARRGHLQEVLAQLGGLRAQGPSRLQDVSDALAEGLRQRTVVALFTDMLDGGLDALASLGRLRARRHDVVLFHVLHPDELEFPFEEATTFTSMEDDREVKVDARAIRSAYLEEMNKFRRSVEATCQKARIEYRLLRTDQGPGRVLAAFLTERLRRRATLR